MNMFGNCFRIFLAVSASMCSSTHSFTGPDRCMLSTIWPKKVPMSSWLAGSMPRRRVNWISSKLWIISASLFDGADVTT